MLYDVQAQAQRRHQNPEISQNEQDISGPIANLSITASIEGSIGATSSTCLSLSVVQNTFYKLGPGIESVRSSALSGRPHCESRQSICGHSALSTNCRPPMQIRADNRTYGIHRRCCQHSSCRGPPRQFTPTLNTHTHSRQKDVAGGDRRGNRGTRNSLIPDRRHPRGGSSLVGQLLGRLSEAR